MILMMIEGCVGKCVFADGLCKLMIYCCWAVQVDSSCWWGVQVNVFMPVGCAGCPLAYELNRLNLTAGRLCM